MLLLLPSLMEESKKQQTRLQSAAAEKQRLNISFLFHLLPS
jgi:hypothetical protein